MPEHLRWAVLLGAFGPSTRRQVADLPVGLRFHELRHYFASLLISAGLDVKVVQARLRHASAMTTLNPYGHLWPETDDSSRAAVAVAMAARENRRRGELRSPQVCETWG